jgi:hypothetical protein
MASDLKFGDVVIITHKLKRTDEQRCSDWWKVWVVRKFKVPKTGILIGLRTLANGITYYEEDSGRLFVPKEYVRAALVALSIRTKPVLVLLDAVENEIKIGDSHV